MATELATAYIQVVPSAEGISGSLTEMFSGEAESAGASSGKKFSAGMTGALKTVGLATAAVGTAAAAATGAIVNGAKDVASYGDNVDKMSQKLGLSASAYQEWDYVLNLAGTDMASMTTGLKTLTNKFDDAKNGSEDAQKMFSQLGISMEDISSMSREDLFAAAIEGFQGMEDSTERAALANDLFGKSGQNLTPLFNQTAEKTAEQIALAEEYGMVMSDDMVSASAAFVDSQTTLQNTLTGLKNSLLGELLPAMTDVNEGLAKVFAGDMTGLEDIDAGIKGFTDTLNEMIPTVIEIGGNIIMSLAEGLIGNLPTLFDSAVSMILQFTEALIENLPLIMDAAVHMVLSLVSGIADSLPVLIPAAVEAVRSLVNGLIQNIPLLITAGIQLLRGVLDGLMQALPDLIASIPEIINALTSTLSENIPLFVEAGVMLLSALVDNLPAIIDAITVAIPQIIEAVIQMTTTLTPMIVSAGVQLFTALIQNMPAIISQIVASIPQIISGIVNAFVQSVPQMANAGRQMITSLGQGLSAMIGSVVAIAGNLASSALSAIRNGFASAVSIGSNLVQGIWNGISSGWNWLTSQISNLATNLLNAAKQKLGINSPSRVFRDQVGKMIDLGLAEGIADNVDPIRKAIASVNDLTTGSITTDISMNTNMAWSQAPALAAVGAGNSITMNITVNGAESPNAWAQEFSQSLKQYMRMA